MTLGLTQPLTEMSTRNLPVGKAQSVRKANNLIAICVRMVYKMCDSDTSECYEPPQPLIRIILSFYLPLIT
jgi:hypothetical protein